MKRSGCRPFYLSIITILFVLGLSACGGGGGGSDLGQGGGGGFVTVSGTLPGTVTGGSVIVVDETGSAAASCVASGSPLAFSFTIPVGHRYKFFFVTGAGTVSQNYFLLYETTTTVFIFQRSITINLGLITLDLGTGRATATIGFLTQTGVTSGGTDASVPAFISGTIYVGTTWTFFPTSGEIIYVDGFSGSAAYENRIYYGGTEALVTPSYGSIQATKIQQDAYWINAGGTYTFWESVIGWYGYVNNKLIAFRVTENGTTWNGEGVWLDFPLFVGKSWQSAYQGISFTATVESTSETLILPYGTLTGVVKVKYTLAGGDFVYQYYHPDYWFYVKWEKSSGESESLQGAYKTWEKSFADKGQYWTGSVAAQSSDGGYIAIGSIFDNVNLQLDIYLVKVDDWGNVVWDKVIGGSGTNETANLIQQTSDGGYIVVGVTMNKILPVTSDVYLAKTDEGGNIVWEKTYGEAGYQYHGNSVVQTSDGGFIIGGYSLYDAFLIKTDASGNEIWKKKYEYVVGSIDQIYSVQQTSDGGYIAAGFANYGATWEDTYLLKTDGSGNVMWQQAFDMGGGFGADDEGMSVLQTLDGGYIVAGIRVSGSSFLLKTDNLGNYLWDKTYVGGDRVDLFSVQQTTDGGFIAAGAILTDVGSLYVSDYYIIKTDISGNVIWERAYGRTGDFYEVFRSVRQTSDGGYIACGGSGDGFLYLVKIDLNGNVQ